MKATTAIAAQTRNDNSESSVFVRKKKTKLAILTALAAKLLHPART